MGTPEQQTQQQQDIGNGALFRNDRKEKDAHPDYRGLATIDGAGEVRIAGWIRKSRKGDTYLSLAFRVDERTQDAPADTSGLPAPEDNEALPF